MNGNAMIRLKEDYVFFQEDLFVCVYRKSTKLVILKLKAGKDAWNDAVKEDLKRPHGVEWLSKQPYWNWLGILLLKHQELFEELTEAEAEKATERADYFSVVNPTHFAENFQVDPSFEQTRIYLWGATALNKLLFENLKEFVPEVYMIRRAEDVADAGSFAGISGEKQLEEGIPQDRIIPEKELKDRGGIRDALFLADGTGMSADRLVELNDYVTERKAAALFYNNTNRENVIGPLVVGGESACLRCMQNQGVLKEFYPGENGFLDRPGWHLFAFFILRILYYIKGKNLYYLLSDAQIPINKVMTVSRDDMTAKMKYLYRDTSCTCCK